MHFEGVPLKGHDRDTFPEFAIRLPPDFPPSDLFVALELRTTSSASCAPKMRLCGQAAFSTRMFISWPRNQHPRLLVSNLKINSVSRNFNTDSDQEAKLFFQAEVKGLSPQQVGHPELHWDSAASLGFAKSSVFTVESYRLKNSIKRKLQDLDSDDPLEVALGFGPGYTERLCLFNVVTVRDLADTKLTKQEWESQRISQKQSLSWKRLMELAIQAKAVVLRHKQQHDQQQHQHQQHDQLQQQQQAPEAPQYDEHTNLSLYHGPPTTSTQTMSRGNEIAATHTQTVHFGWSNHEPNVNANPNIYGNNYNPNIYGNNYNPNIYGNNYNQNIYGNNYNQNVYGNNYNQNICGNNYSQNMYGNNYNQNVCGNDHEPPNIISTTHMYTPANSTYREPPNIINTTHAHMYSCMNIYQPPYNTGVTHTQLNTRNDENIQPCDYSSANNHDPPNNVHTTLTCAYQSITNDEPMNDLGETQANLENYEDTNNISTTHSHAQFNVYNCNPTHNVADSLAQSASLLINNNHYESDLVETLLGNDSMNCNCVDVGSPQIFGYFGRSQTPSTTPITTTTTTTTTPITTTTTTTPITTTTTTTPMATTTVALSDFSDEYQQQTTQPEDGFIDNWDWE